jgi:glucosyl-3-phosphoglycerate synthase
VDTRAQQWCAARTTASRDWPLSRVAELKRAAGARVSVVIPARNEAATIADVVRGIRAELVDADAAAGTAGTAGPVVDELVVMDSLSTDDTAAVAAGAGADVHSVADVVPELGVRAGKGEALWKSLFVTTGDVLVFVDADLTDWGTHFVTGLLGPLLAEPQVALVKGFYDRVLEMADGPNTQGGRVTELVARPLLALSWPQLSAVVQPLAGEWAIRRSLFETLPVPVGYGVELATLLDTTERLGLDALAQVDLGRRAHRHQSVHDLGVMATEILAVAARRGGPSAQPAGDVELAQYLREDGWISRLVPTDERPPAVSAYRGVR